MPISLSAITGKTKSVAVEWEGETITVSYSPAQYTPNYIDALNAKQRAAESIEDATEQGRQFAEMACEVVKAWDIQDENGAVLPATPDNMALLPVALIQAMIVAITVDLRPNENGGATVSGSF